MNEGVGVNGLDDIGCAYLHWNLRAMRRLVRRGLVRRSSIMLLPCSLTASRDTSHAARLHINSKLIPESGPRELADLHVSDISVSLVKTITVHNAFSCWMP